MFHTKKLRMMIYSTNVQENDPYMYTNPQIGFDGSKILLKVLMIR